MFTSKVLNPNLLHDWAEPRGLHVENQTPFQALPSSSSGAADVQGSSKAPSANLHVRAANLLTFCHSLTHVADKAHTQKHTCMHVQKHTAGLDEDKVRKTDFKQGNYLYPSFLSDVPECSFLSWGYSVSLQLTLISFCSAAWKNTACSHRQRKFIYITSSLKAFKTQLSAKSKLAESSWAYFGLLREWLSSVFWIICCCC